MAHPVRPHRRSTVTVAVVLCTVAVAMADSVSSVAGTWTVPPAGEHALESALQRIIDATRAEAVALGGPPRPATASLPVLPSEAALGLFRDRPATSADAAALAVLDAFSLERRSALVTLLLAVDAYDRAARVTFGQTGGASSAVPADGLAALMASRADLLEALLPLRDALEGASAAERIPPIRIPGVIAVDLVGTDDTYTDDYRVQLDVGGHDTYLNNAGGALAGAAVLVDLAGNDRYVSARNLGINGGGNGGAGFLADMAGDDTYEAGSQGVNGGAVYGAGFLLDVAGNDTYIARGTPYDGVNGSTGAVIWVCVPFMTLNLWHCIVYMPVSSGLAALIDLGGRDAYSRRWTPSTCWDCSYVPHGAAGAQLDAAGVPLPLG